MNAQVTERTSRMPEKSDKDPFSPVFIEVNRSAEDICQFENGSLDIKLKVHGYRVGWEMIGNISKMNPRSGLRK
jgi:hypothetical protein